MATPEAVEFAALLKKLKDRSGLSYGVLAGRLHVSTSTLHRYCNGDAVPNEYAPVERLGRLCGASPEELVELHRRWIVADAARRRPSPAPAPGPAPVPGPAPAPDVARTPAPVPAAGSGTASEADDGREVRDGDGDGGDRGDGGGRGDSGSRGDVGGHGDGGGRGDGVRGGGERERDGGGVATPGSASVEPATTPTPAPVEPATTPTPASAPVDASASDVSVSVSGPAAAAEAGAGVGSGRFRWFRSSPRTRVLLAVAAVVALTVPTTVVVNKLSATDDVALSDIPASADVLEPGPSESPARRTHGGTASPGTPSPTADPSGPESARTSSAGPTASSGPEAGAGRGNEAPAVGGVPVTAAISSYNWDAPCDEYYVLDQEPEDVPPPPTPMDGRSWARALGAVDGAHQLIELTVQGTSRQPVVLNALHVRQVSKKAPLPWSVYATSLGCGSGVTPQSFDIDLDDDRPRTRPVPGQRGDTVIPAKDFPFKVSSTDVEVFDLKVHVEAHEVSWYLELEWSSGGRSGTLRIDDGGKPFRVSAIKTRPQYSYWYDKARWTAD
ncbi:helix-turn-helix domain-containing protein [Streptomyces sp. NPDC052042]|uniref:helix-turn-helix domain-containing protein n=1 Tax=Streptomyces sp. NPDC052042 TaxID=3365683 RepID=UPI0037CF4B07